MWRTLAHGDNDATASANAVLLGLDGPGLVDEGSPYPPGLFGSASTTHLLVGWGDGASSAIPTAPPSATHVYTAGTLPLAVASRFQA